MLVDLHQPDSEAEMRCFLGAWVSQIWKQ